MGRSGCACDGMYVCGEMCVGVIVCVCVVNGKGFVWVWCEERNVWCLRSGVCVGVSEGRWCNIIYLLYSYQ